MYRGVILYGPPASGKDTVTTALAHKSGAFRLYPRLKCGHGSGRTDGYRMISSSELAALRGIPGEVIYENNQYEATYAVDRSYLTSMVRAGVVPVVLLGQVRAVEAVTRELTAITWLVVELRCERHVAANRIRARATGDTDERMRVFDATVPLNTPDLVIDTGRSSADESATAIIESVMARTERVPAGRGR